MKRLLAVICLTTLCLALNTWAADQNADFSGTWILDSEKSDLAPIPVRDLGAAVGRGRGGGRGGPPMGGPMPGGGRGFGGAAPKIENSALVIQQTDTEFRIVSGTIINGKQNLTEEVYKLDGKEKVLEVPIQDSEDTIKYATKVELKKDKFKIRSKRNSPQNTYEVKKELSLSKDGKVLTLKTSTMNQTGLNVFQTEQKQVYDKQ